MTAYAREAFGLTVDTRTDKWMRVWDGENLLWVRLGSTSQLVSWDWDNGGWKSAYADWRLMNLAPEHIADALDAIYAKPW